MLTSSDTRDQRGRGFVPSRARLIQMGNFTLATPEWVAVQDSEASFAAWVTRAGGSKTRKFVAVDTFLGGLPSLLAEVAPSQRWFLG